MRRIACLLSFLVAGLVPAADLDVKFRPENAVPNYAALCVFASGEMKGRHEGIGPLRDAVKRLRGMGFYGPVMGPAHLQQWADRLGVKAWMKYDRDPARLFQSLERGRPVVIGLQRRHAVLLTAISDPKPLATGLTDREVTYLDPGPGAVYQTRMPWRQFLNVWDGSTFDFESPEPPKAQGPPEPKLFGGPGQPRLFGGW